MIIDPNAQTIYRSIHSLDKDYNELVAQSNFEHAVITLVSSDNDGISITFHYGSRAHKTAWCGGSVFSREDAESLMAELKVENIDTLVDQEIIVLKETSPAGCFAGRWEGIATKSQAWEDACRAKKTAAFGYDPSAKREELGTANVTHRGKPDSFEFSYLPETKQIEVRYEGNNSVYKWGKLTDEGTDLSPEFHEAFQSLWAKRN